MLSTLSIPLCDPLPPLDRAARHRCTSTRAHSPPASGRRRASARWPSQSDRRGAAPTESGGGEGLGVASARRWTRLSRLEMQRIECAPNCALARPRAGAWRAGRGGGGGGGEKGGTRSRRVRSAGRSAAWPSLCAAGECRSGSR
eukprot:6064216-Pleurochrysis_carterae.AAC.2